MLGFFGWMKKYFSKEKGWLGAQNNIAYTEKIKKKNDGRARDVSLEKKVYNLSCVL